MSWVTIKSPAAQKRSRIGFSFKLWRHGRGMFTITLPSVLSGRLGFDREGVETCNVHMGDGDHAGKMWIEPRRDGEFRITRLKHCCYLRVPPPSGLVLKENSADLDYETAPDGGFIITLPTFAVRGAGEAAPSKQAGEKPESLEINGNTLIMGAREVTLTRSQSTLMARLANDFGKCVNRQALLDDLYSLDPNGGADAKILDVYISKIRSILAEKGFPLSIITHTGAGWELRRSQT